MIQSLEEFQAGNGNKAVKQTFSDWIKEIQKNPNWNLRTEGSGSNQIAIVTDKKIDVTEQNVNQLNPLTGEFLMRRMVHGFKKLSLPSYTVNCLANVGYECTYDVLIFSFKNSCHGNHHRRQ